MLAALAIITAISGVLLGLFSAGASLHRAFVAEMEPEPKPPAAPAPGHVRIFVWPDGYAKAYGDPHLVQLAEQVDAADLNWLQQHGATWLAVSRAAGPDPEPTIENGAIAIALGIALHRIHRRPERRPAPCAGPKE